MVNPFLDNDFREVTHVLLGQLSLDSVEVCCDIAQLADSELQTALKGGSFGFQPSGLVRSGIGRDI